MANLNTFQTQLIEKLFQMESGYVLNFSDRTMSDFFKAELGVDIFDEKYNQGSGSKANRLRGFINNEDNKIIGELFNKLIKYIQNNLLLNNLKEKDYPAKLIDAVTEVANNLTASTTVSNNSIPSSENSIFPNDKFGLFISHKDDNKTEANDLKQSLNIFGISCFVAHEDIEPSTEWQNEIEKALFSMDALLALLSPGFSSSVWTNQEVGVAFGRDCFILSVRSGEDPKGFVGKFQALRPNSDKPFSTAVQIAEHLLNHQKTSEKMKNAYIHALSQASQYAETEKWASIIDLVNSLSDSQAQKIVENYNSSSQRYGCFRLNGGKYGRDKNIADYLNEWTGNKKYVLSNKRIKVNVIYEEDKVL